MTDKSGLFVLKSKKYLIDIDFYKGLGIEL